VRGGLSCALVRAWLGWFVDFDLRLAPQHLRNGGLEPQVRPRNIFDRKVVVWEHQRGGGGGRAYQLYVIMWRFLHKRTSHRPPAPLSNAQMAPGGTNATTRTRRPPTQPDSALKSHSQEWNFGGSRTCGAQVLPAQKKILTASPHPKTALPIGEMRESPHQPPRHHLALSSGV
jgi:hypothetical protein